MATSAASPAPAAIPEHIGPPGLPISLPGTMAEFLQAQSDYILFVHGLAFIGLGAVCFAIGAKRSRDLPWAALGAFGLAHGAYQWLELLAYGAGNTPAFAWARQVLMAASYVPLLEFARLGAARLGRKAPGRWIYAPALLLVVLGAAAGGLAAADGVARYVLCLAGGAVVGLVLVLLSRELPHAESRWALFAAAGFALYGLAAGAVVPAAALWPAQVPDHDAFRRATGMPVQFLRALLAGWLVFSIGGLWRQRIMADLASTIHARQLRTLFVWTLIVIVAILASGWLLTEYLGRRAGQEMRDGMRSDFSLLASRLRIETVTADNVARAMGDSPWVLPALAQGAPNAQGEADRFVDAYKGAAGEAAVVYLMNADGTVIASSNRFETDSLVGNNFRFRPYFLQAMAGQCAHYFALGPTAGERGYYTSCPVRDKSGRAIGATALKKVLDALEFEFKQFEHAYLVDSNGVVFLASDSQLLFRLMWPLPAEARRALSDSRQFGELRHAPVLDREVEDETWVEFEGARHYAGRHFIGDERWALVGFRAVTAIAASRILGITITLLFAILVLGQFARTRQLMNDKIALAKRLELEEHARELGVRASTDPLTGAYNRLKFNEELAKEIARRARYGVPLSLVMFDIDHFKAVNDTHGHQQGDQVLVGLCRLIAQNIRQTDVLARWGGEEFVILASNCGARDAFRLAQKLRIVAGNHVFDAVGAVTCSFGVAEFQDDDSAESFLLRADQALYRAKTNGRNRAEMA